MSIYRNLIQVYYETAIEIKLYINNMQALK